MSKKPHFIKEWRKYRGLTQAQLAEQIDIAVSYVSKIENGRRRYDQPFLEAAAIALRCETPDLIAWDPKESEGIWSLWRGMSPSEKQQAIAVVRALKKTGGGA